jgi:hypothetical protein
MKCMALSSVTFFILFWFHFLSLCIWLYVLYASVQFCKLCNFIMFVYSYCNVNVFLLLCMFCSVYSVSLCCSVCCLCVNVYCTILLPPGVNPIAVNKIYHVKSILRIQISGVASEPCRCLALSARYLGIDTHFCMP